MSVEEFPAPPPAGASPAAHGADAAIAAWRDVDDALAPIIGRRGVAAIYQHSLDLTRANHPWLSAACAAAAELGGFAPLHQALVQQTPANAAAAQHALLRTFRAQLAGLIGGSLAGQLLRYRELS